MSSYLIIFLALYIIFLIISLYLSYLVLYTHYMQIGEYLVNSKPSIAEIILLYIVSHFPILNVFLVLCILLVMFTHKSNYDNWLINSFKN